MKTFKIYKNNTHINSSIYFNKSNLPKNKNKSTYNLKKVLKDRTLTFKTILIDICFSSGFGNNINETKHLILNKCIKLNNNIVTQPNIKIKSGDIITCIDKRCLLNYYKQKWSVIKLNSGRPSDNKLKIIEDLEKIDFKLKNNICTDVYSDILLKGRYKKLIDYSERDRNNILNLSKKPLSMSRGKKLVNKKTYKKYKYLISNNRIHRLSYNTILWL